MRRKTVNEKVAFVIFFLVFQIFSQSDKNALTYRDHQQCNTVRHDATNKKEIKMIDPLQQKMFYEEYEVI